MRITRQPLLGLVTLVAMMVLSLAFISLFPADTFGSWVAFYMMCTIPFTFVVGAFWHGKHPARLAALGQPWSGIGFLLLAAAVGAIVGTLLLFTVGGGITPPTPIVTQCVIISVPFSFWFAVMWGGWPFNKLGSPMLGGVLVIVATYAVAIVVFQFFDFAFLAGAPVYAESIDPKGPFDAWTVLLLVVTSMAAAFILAHFDLWPITKRPRLMAQPMLGLVWTIKAVVIAAVAMYLGLHVAGMAPAQFLTTVPVPFLFGSIVIINVFQGSLFARIPQPAKGVVSTIAAALLGLVLARFYIAVSPAVSGQQEFGAPSFAGELWLANALLAVTFPFLAYFGDFFHLWPLQRNRSAEPTLLADEPAAMRDLHDAIE